MGKNNNKIRNFIENIPIVTSVLRWSKSYSPPGFRGIDLYSFISFVLQELKKDNITTRANSVAFSLFLSVFPAIIFLFTLLPLFPAVRDYTSMLNEQLKDVLPENAHSYIFSKIYDITSIKRDGLLSIGAILAMYFSSNGMLTLMMGFDKSYNEAFLKRPWWKSRLVALALTLILFLLLVISLFITIIEDYILDWFKYKFDVSDALLSFASLFNWLFSIFIIYTGISLIFTFGPSMYRRIRFINIGSVAATVFLLLSSIVFSYFINNFGRYNEIYGSIGALIVIMIWLQLNSLILLIGFELNSALVIQRYNRKRQLNQQLLNEE